MAQIIRNPSASAEGDAVLRRVEEPSSAVGSTITPWQAYRETKVFGALDGIRALCCLAVVKEHVKWAVGFPKSLDHGYLGVDMFFAISGFLIVTLLIRERETRGEISVRNFYARRTLRIFPI